VTRASRLLPDPAELSADQIYADLNLPAGPDDRPYVVANMVSTVDGNATVGGRARGIGSRLDRSLMRRIRAAVDALLVGSGTLRAEPVDPLVPVSLAEARQRRGEAPQPLAVTISHDLDLDPNQRFFRQGAANTLIVTSRSAPPARALVFQGQARLVTVGERQVDLATALRRLRSSFGIGRLLVEGGPRLNRALLDLDAIDELFLTIAPKLGGDSSAGLIQGPPRGLTGLRLISLYACEDELFARYRVGGGTS
jgi:riboflavin-specific deaminase-like protein